MSKPTPDRYHLVFTPLSDDVPAIARLRRLLKMALRSYRLRCSAAWIEDEAGQVQSLPADDQEQAGEAGPS